MAKTSKTMINSCGESGHPCLFPDKRVNAFNFSPLRIIFAVGLSNTAFIMLRLDKTLESPLGCKEIQPVHSEGDQPWDCFGRNDSKAETPVLCPPHAKS